MKQSKTCPKCEGKDVVRARPLDYGHGNINLTLRLAVYKNPDAFIFRGKKTTDLESLKKYFSHYVSF